jgi:hypothetical protein
MGVRRMTGIERKKMRALAGSLLFGGEHKDDVRKEIASCLYAAGWHPTDAGVRAREVVDAAEKARA